MKSLRRGSCDNPNITKNWISEHGDSVTTQLLAKNFAIANKIKSILDAKNIKPAQWAEQLGKDKSEISKWLSGHHNFTTKTIVKIEDILGEEIIHIEPKEKIVYITAYIQNIKHNVADLEFNESEYAIANG